MKTYFSYFWKKLGISFVIIAFILSGIASIDEGLDGFSAGYAEGPNSSQYNDAGELVKHDVVSENVEIILSRIVLAFSLAGLLLYMFSAEKVEDELIRKLRYECLAKSLLYTWIFAGVLFIINGDVKLQGFHILQFLLFVYVILLTYNKYVKYE
ncbi:MAG: hypothetical protein U9R54_09535 [Bacteroidota bacterium]|nr:hypothetical protein [Bacteroidota bacterium]